MASPYTATANTKMLLRFEDNLTDSAGVVTDLVKPTYSNPTYVTGRFSKAISLTDTGSSETRGFLYRSGGTKSFTEPTGDSTISLWIKRNAAQPGDPWILFRSENQSVTHTLRYEYLANDFTNLGIVYNRNIINTPVNNYSVLANAGVHIEYTITDSAFVNIVATYSESAGRAYLYVDGALKCTSGPAITTPYPTPVTFPTNVGYINAGSDNGALCGDMIYDDLVVENIAWDAAKVSLVAGSGYITSHPSDLLINEGATAVFSVVSQGDSLTYQWHQQPGPGPYSDMAGETSSTLSFTSSMSLTGYRYRVTVTDGYGNTETSSIAILTVFEYDPPIVGSLDSKYYYSGESVTFEGSATGMMAGAYYQWQKDI